MNRSTPKPQASDALGSFAAATRAFLDHQHVDPGKPLVAAVSGGVDSTALALVLARLRDAGHVGELILAYVDHGCHPSSQGAGRRVAELARRLRAGYATRGLAPRRSRPSEARLREGRYAALVEIARAHGAADLCTAHHADDQIETVLFRALRGTGPRGLAGIPRTRQLGAGVRVLRPFLGQRRAALARLVNAAGETPYEDPTNRDRRYTRNRIRHDILPRLRQRGDVDRHVLALAERARRVTRALTHRASDELAKAGAVGDWRLHFALSTPSPDAAVLLEAIVDRAHRQLRPGASPPWEWVRRVADLAAAAPGTRVAGHGYLLAERTRHGLLLADPRRCGEPPPGDCCVPLETRVRFGTTEWRITIRRVRWRPPVRDRAATRVVLAAAGPWRLRARRAGDRFHPLGQPRPVELRRFLQARHVPRFDRDRLPLLVDSEDRILWVPGVEIAATAAVNSARGTHIEARLDCR